MTWLTDGNINVRGGLPIEGASSNRRTSWSWLRRNLTAPRQARLSESNIAGIGSKKHRSLAKKAAATDRNIKNAGQKVGLEIWRVNNKRTAGGAPDFGIEKVNQNDYGVFYTGDSYIVLNTYKARDETTGQPGDKLCYDLFFWLGEESTDDERGVAAKKTVEIDDILDGNAVQHRETQYRESKLFHSLFKEMQYQKGGYASGFLHVEAQTYEPRLFMIRSSKNSTRAFEIECLANKMNHGDAFVLDIGPKVYRWTGVGANPFELSKSGMLQSNIVNSRNGRSRKAPIDSDFWAILRGSEADVLPEDQPYIPRSVSLATNNVEDPGRAAVPDPTHRWSGETFLGTRVYKISDSLNNGVKFVKVAEGPHLGYSILDSDDVFLLHHSIGIWLWFGNRASKAEKSHAFSIADSYIKERSLSKGMPITALTESQASLNPLFHHLLPGA